MNTIKITLGNGTIVEIPTGINVDFSVNGNTVSIKYLQEVKGTNEAVNWCCITNYNGRKIDAIKAVRELSMDIDTVMRLAEAKNVVETYQNFRIGYSVPQYEVQNTITHLRSLGMDVTTSA